MSCEAALPGVCREIRVTGAVPGARGCPPLPNPRKSAPLTQLEPSNLWSLCSRLCYAHRSRKPVQPSAKRPEPSALFSSRNPRYPRNLWTFFIVNCPGVLGKFSIPAIIIPMPSMTAAYSLPAAPRRRFAQRNYSPATPAAEFCEAKLHNNSAQRNYSLTAHGSRITSPGTYS
jgi:hypothetical protein